ncbi:MAG: hypothetical protein J2P27_14245 [Actinobacteria bacterium]|nr:hypothetical protein [Actinomycetota bacterium]
MLRARIEVSLSVLLGTATIVTVAWPKWIEGLFGFDPDGGTGKTELWIIAGLAAITIAAATVARRDLRIVRQGHARA